MGDPVERIVDRLIFFIERASDPDVIAERSPRGLNMLLLTAREVGPIGNGITVRVSLSAGARMTADPVNTTLSGGDFDRGPRRAGREQYSGLRERRHLGPQPDHLGLAFHRRE